MAVTLAQLIREARLRLDMTQGQLAKNVGCSMENITAIENGRNHQPAPQVSIKLARALDLAVEDIYYSIAGTMERLPWDRAGELDLKDPELELMFRQVDGIPEAEPKDRVKAFIRFTLDEERKRRRRQVSDT